MKKQLFMSAFAALAILMFAACEKEPLTAKEAVSKQSLQAAGARQTVCACFDDTTSITTRTRLAARRIEPLTGATPANEETAQ